MLCSVAYPSNSKSKSAGDRQCTHHECKKKNIIMISAVLCTFFPDPLPFCLS